MAHRGRLNVLSNILGKTYEQIFTEFEGNINPDLTMGDGDVKYHLGYASIINTPSANKIYVKLTPNPSHLEVVDSLVLGYTRGQIDDEYKGGLNKAMAILIHGDAAVAGQGIVYELTQMSGLEVVALEDLLHHGLAAGLFDRAREDRGRDPQDARLHDRRRAASAAGRRGPADGPARRSLR